MRKSASAVLWGIFLALGVGVVLVFGIIAPILTRFVGQGLASTSFPLIFVVFAAAFAFYWGGMIAAYKAPSRRRLHGVAVGISSFAVSPLVNLGASALTPNAADPFANLRTPGAALLTGVVFAAVLAASYIGARRGEVLHAHNQAHIEARERRRKAQENADQPSP
jgi:hypothetical protein